eukprot:scaffold2911_cov414-Prasinococcus_capsulatus_cf.AAC.56
MCESFISFSATKLLLRRWPLQPVASLCCRTHAREQLYSANKRQSIKPVWDYRRQSGIPHLLRAQPGHLYLASSFPQLSHSTPPGTCLSVPAAAVLHPPSPAPAHWGPGAAHWALPSPAALLVRPRRVRRAAAGKRGTYSGGWHPPLRC